MSDEEKVMRALDRDEKEQQEIVEKLRAITSEKITFAIDRVSRRCNTAEDSTASFNVFIYRID